MSVINRTKALTGHSFDLADLTIIRSWAAAYGLQMVVRLDHGSDTEEYEEVLSFHVGTSCLCRWIMWRNTEAVFIHPLVGRRLRFDSVAKVIEVLGPPEVVQLTDIDPTCLRDPEQTT